MALPEHMPEQFMVVALQREIESRINQIIATSIKDTKEKIEAEIRGSVGEIALRVLNNYSITRNQTAVIIEVKNSVGGSADGKAEVQ